jgi:outer membrane protein OmpA-like peptidoglycan-associated protein
MSIRRKFKFLVPALFFAGIFTFGSLLHAENQKPEVEIDFSVLKDLNPAKPASRTPAGLPTAVQPVTREPAKPALDTTSIQKFPVKERVRSDSLNPAAPASAPAPIPEVAASLAPAKTNKKAAAPAKRTSTKKTLQPAKKPVARKPPAAKSKTREGKKTIVIPAKPTTIMSSHAHDPLEKKLAIPDKKKLARDIDAVHKTIDMPFRSSPETAGNPVTKTVITPAENVSGVLPEKHSMPRPPPEDPRETNFFTIPFKPGTDELDKQITETLRSQVLPLLKDHPSWRMQIRAFASTVDKEPISARRISLARALAVRSWLLDKGVEARRLDLKALGLQTDREPPDRVDMVFIDPGMPGG